MKQTMTASYTSSSLINHGVSPRQFGMAYKANQKKQRRLKRIRGYLLAFVLLSATAILSGCGSTSPSTKPVLPPSVFDDGAWTPRGFNGPPSPVPGWQHHKVGLVLGDLQAKRRAARRILKAPVGWDCPPHLDNSDYCTPLENQGNNPWCAAYSMGQLLQASWWREHHVKKDISEAALYAGAKSLDDDHNSDGTSLENIIYAAQTVDFGVGVHPVLETESVWELDDVIFGCHKYGLVLVGLQITDGWEHLNSDGTIGPGTKVLGGHAVLVSGYDQQRRLIWGPNWWGKDWGRGGWWVMTYDQFAYQFAYGYGVRVIWNQETAK